MTNSTGTVCYEADFYPFGGERVITGTCSQSYKFAGMEQDAETGLNHTLFRQQSSSLGRWYSPDPLAGNILNPQSLNRYTYALNNPCNLVDPLGLSPCTLNIELINKSGVAAANIAQAQQQINAILGASAWGGVVQVQFQSGAIGADLMLTLTNGGQRAQEKGWYGFQAIGRSPRVYTDMLQTAVTVPNYGAAIGSVGLHELLHRFGWVDLDYSTPANNMMFDGAPSQVQRDALNDPNNQLWNLTHTQAQALHDYCTGKHPQKSGGEPGGGGSQPTSAPYDYPQPPFDSGGSGAVSGALNGTSQIPGSGVEGGPTGTVTVTDRVCAPGVPSC